MFYTWGNAVEMKSCIRDRQLSWMMKNIDFILKCVNWRCHRPSNALITIKLLLWENCEKFRLYMYMFIKHLTTVQWLLWIVIVMVSNRSDPLLEETRNELKHHVSCTFCLFKVDAKWLRKQLSFQCSELCTLKKRYADYLGDEIRLALWNGKW